MYRGFVTFPPPPVSESLLSRTVQLVETVREEDNRAGFPHLLEPITAPESAIRHKLPVSWHRVVSAPALIDYQQLYSSRQAACCFGQRNRRVPLLSMTVLPTFRAAAACSLQGFARDAHGVPQGIFSVRLRAHKVWVVLSISLPLARLVQTSLTNHVLTNPSYSCQGQFSGSPSNCLSPGLSSCLVF